jgi:hypothetical protein
MIPPPPPNWFEIQTPLEKYLNSGKGKAGQTTVVFIETCEIGEKPNDDSDVYNLCTVTDGNIVYDLGVHFYLTNVTCILSSVKLRLHVLQVSISVAFIPSSQQQRS